MCVQKDYDEVMEQLVRGIHTREIIYKEEGSEAFDYTSLTWVSSLSIG